MTWTRPRRRCLSDAAIWQYQRHGWHVVRSEHAESAQELYELCCRLRLPYVLIIKPRRYCELEVSTTPVSGGDLDTDAPQLALPAIRRIHGFASDALAASPCPAKRRYLNIHATGGTVRGLELDTAKHLASEIFTILASRHSYMGGGTDGKR